MKIPIGSKAVLDGREFVVVAHTVLSDDLRTRRVPERSVLMQYGGG